MKIIEKAKRYTEMYRGVLHPCKYCGNTDIQIWYDRSVIGPTKYSWTVNCMTPNCDFTLDTSIRRAVEKWNNRHPPSSKQEDW